MLDTLFTGRRILFLERVDSTNNYAAKLIRANDFTEGSVIVAEEQTAGRGRRDNQWLSTPGENLLTSIILKPTFLHVHQTFALNIVSSLAVHDTLEAYGISSSIKWPNDILVGHEKIAGILIETHIRGSHMATAIVGVGLNINQTVFDHPSASSMKSLRNLDFDLREVLFTLCSKLEMRYLLLRQGNDKNRTDYLQHLFGLNEVRKYLIGGTETSAVLVDVESGGHAIFEVAGKEVRCAIDDVVWQY